MRKPSPLGLVLGLAVGLFTACSAQNQNAASAGASGAPSTGEAGGAGGGSTADGGAGGMAGEAGQPSAGGAGGGGACRPELPGPACGDVPPEGVCVCGNRIQSCLVPPPGVDQPSKLVADACGDKATCTIEKNGTAYCKLNTACSPGDALCDQSGKLLTCKADGSGYDIKTCDAGSVCSTPPGQQSQCVPELAAAASNKDTLDGQVLFERRSLSKTGVTDIKVDPAFLNFVAVYNGDKYIGYAITDAEGKFHAELSQPATIDTLVYFYVMDFAPDSDQPLVAVAHATDASPLTHNSTEYWHWANKGDSCLTPVAVTPNGAGPGQHTIAPITIPEKCGSGAIRAFQWVRYGFYQLSDKQNGLQATRSKKQDSLLVFWEPGLSFAETVCVACFLGKQFGGATVTPSGTTTMDMFDTAILVSGSNEYPTEWSYSAVSHETGHWVMATYSKTPGEGGKHYVAQASIPGLAYSEGWATAFGQWNASDTPNNVYNSLYVDTQGGVTFWVDIAQGTYFRGDLERPNSQGPIDQNINENIVAGLIWYLWHPTAAGSGAYQGLGAEKIFTAFQSDRLITMNRGYKKVDLIDFFDAHMCSKTATNDNVTAVSQQFGYPWDSTPLCP